ncbi:MAG: cell division protein FtsA [Candidatus Hydrogenedentes bacterium]|nr:cell division protein FtsA [Candidatus Hydrogenedentota bacterium]
MRGRGEIVSVVDFGSRDIRVLVARRDNDGTIQIIGHGTAPAHGCVSQGVIQDRAAAQLSLKRALNFAEKESRTKITSVFCGVNGKKVETFIREGTCKIERDIVEHSNMIEARDIASRDILAPGKRVTSSISAQEWYVDDMRVIDPIGIRGQVLKTRIHFARLPAVIEDNIVTCIESQGRELEDMIFVPIASALGCLTPEDLELGVGVLDLGRGITGLAIYRDFRILGTHCFEWGGYHITRDVAAGLQVSFEEADELILEYGISEACIHEEFDETPESLRGDSDDSAARVKLRSNVPGSPSVVDRVDLDGIVYERAKELLVKVRQHIQARGLTKNLVRGIVLTGGAASIKKYTDLAEAVFQVPCRIGMPTGVEVLPNGVESPEFSAAIGIARHAFEFRAAARHGRIEPRGSMVSVSRRAARFLKRYFL